MTATRNKIPTVKPIVSSGTISLNFTYRGQRYKKSLGKESKAALRKAESLCDRINLDLLDGRFTGLDPYFSPIKPVEIAKPSHRSFSYLDVVESFLGVSEQEGKLTNGHLEAYRTIVNKLRKHKTLEVLLDNEVSDKSRNRTLKLIKSALTKLKIEIPKDFPELVRISKESKDIFEQVFTEDEISKILEFFKDSKDYSHYYSFVKFRFLTGCRPSEAIALHWSDIDFKNNRLTIKRSYTVRDGLQGRKNSEVTYLPINESLRALLTSQEGLHKDLVFPSPSGTFIHLGNFDRRAWKACKLATGVNKIFYSIRHTVLSNLVQTQGLASAAYVAGHKSLEMVQRHYGKLLSVPELPSL